MPQENEVLQAALSYARRGWLVLPCHPADKRPIPEAGLYAATTDETTIRQWWTSMPGAMIGLRTGRESSIWVIDLDVDPDKGINGIEAFKKLCDGKEPIPSTTTVRTPRGGQHLYFKWVEGVRNSAGKLGPGKRRLHHRAAVTAIGRQEL